jgi:hypothetical protein
MKKKSCYILGIFLVILNSCSKCKEGIDPYAGDIDFMEMNGKPWKRFDGWKTKVYAGSPISAYKCYPKDNPDSLFQFSIYYNNEGDESRESIILAHLRPRLGIQKIYKTDYTSNSAGCQRFDVPMGAMYLSAEDGDVQVAEYNVDENANNFINITSFDTYSGEMKGTFELNLIVGSRANYLKLLYPDTIRFKNGQFNTVFVRTK